MAWQFDCPETGEGVVQAFRRGKNAEESATFKLHGLELDAVYILTDLDVEGVEELTGRDLLEKGLSVTLKEKPSAAVITYKKKS
jgi:alpha-galactosidase